MSDDHIARLLERIDEAFDHDLGPVPDPLLTAARDAFAWRYADVNLAELVYDSASDQLIGVRGTSSDRRSFRFAADDFVIRVHLTRATMVVMIEPPLSVACRVVSASDDQEPSGHRTDDLGELVIDVPELPVRVEAELPSGDVVTPWITG